MLEYHPDTGKFYWKVSRGKASAGKEAGCFDGAGYIVITYRTKPYKAHRLAWYFTYQEEPPEVIDHINRIKHDNRISNLRASTSHENSQNIVSPNSNSTSNYLGVTFVRRTGKWRAALMFNNKRHYLGQHDSPEGAYQAYITKKEQLNADFSLCRT